MKILVTGCCGFIGSNFIRHILAKHKDYRIVNIDKLTYAGNLENLKDVEGDARYEFVRGDIADEKFVVQLLEKHKGKMFDGLINFAAESHVDRSIMGGDDFIRTNIEGVHILLKAAMNFGIARFVQISTDEVYGSLHADDPPFTEENNIKPNSIYSASKAAADLLARAYFKTHGYCTIVTRCSNNYGPYQFPEKLIPLFVSNLLENKEVPVYGDGMQVRDWIYVDDHSEAIDLVLRKGRPGEVYNIGADNEVANIDLTKTLLRHLNKPESLIKYVKDRPGHDRRYAMNSYKIRQELGWRPYVDFETGLERTVKWYIDNREWWQRIKSGEYMKYYEKWYGNR